MFPTLSKIILLVLVIYVVRQFFKSPSAGLGAPGNRSRFSAGAQSAGTIWRDLGRARASSRAAATPQKVAVELVRCERCGAYASQGAGCDRADCIRR